MYLDPELQVILTTPINGVTEDLVILHPPNTRDELLRWLNTTIEVEIEELPHQMLSVTIDQSDLLLAFQNDLILAAAVDDGLGTLRLQTWWDVKNGAVQASTLANRFQ